MPINVVTIWCRICSSEGTSCFATASFRGAHASSVLCLAFCRTNSPVRQDAKTEHEDARAPVDRVEATDDDLKQGRMPADILEASRIKTQRRERSYIRHLRRDSLHWLCYHSLERGGLTAQGESPAAQEALEKICRSYWRPLYGFARAQGLSSQDAQDIVQKFFAGLLRRQNFKTIRQEKGRLRSYLLVSLKRFLASQRNRANAVKRYQASPSIPLD